MGCSSAISGCILVVINIIFFIIGLALSAVGGIVKWAPSLFTDQIKTLITTLVSNLTNSAEIQTQLKAVLDQLFAVIGNYGIVLFVIGIVFVVIALLAMCGVCCKSKWILGTYALLMVIITLASIALTIVLFVKTDWVKNMGGTELTKFVQKTYTGPAALTFSEASSTLPFTGMSGVLDIVQIVYQCCGVTNYTDFEGAAKWNRNVSITMTVSGSVATQYRYLTIPISCCKIDSSQLSNINNTALEQCITAPDSSNSNMDTACYTKLWTSAEQYWGYVKYGFIGLSVLLALLSIITFCAMRFDDEKVDPL